MIFMLIAKELDILENQITTNVMLSSHLIRKIDATTSEKTTAVLSLTFLKI